MLLQHLSHAFVTYFDVYSQLVTHLSVKFRYSKLTKPFKVHSMECNTHIFDGLIESVKTLGAPKTEYNRKLLNVLLRPI